MTRGRRLCYNAHTSAIERRVCVAHRTVYGFLLSGDQRRGDLLFYAEARTAPPRARSPRLRPALPGLGGTRRAGGPLHRLRAAGRPARPEHGHPHAALHGQNPADPAGRGAHQQRVRPGLSGTPHGRPALLRAGAHVPHGVGGLHLLRDPRARGRNRAQDYAALLQMVVQPVRPRHRAHGQDGRPASQVRRFLSRGHHPQRHGYRPLFAGTPRRRRARPAEGSVRRTAP